MAKKVNQVSLRGELSTDVMEVVEVTKEGEFTYDLLQILREYDGKQVSITVKEERELEVKEEL